MNIIDRVARATSEPFRIPYIYTVLMGFGLIFLWLIEYTANMNGYGVINTYATIFTNIIIFIIGIAPLYIAYAGEFGALWAAVNLRDPRVGAIKAVGVYFRLVLWMVFANTLVGLTLSTIVFGTYFDGTREVFPNLLLLVVAAVIFGHLFDFGAGWKKRIITGVLLLILGIILWNWLGSDNRAEATGKFTSVFPSSFVCPDKIQDAKLDVPYEVVRGCGPIRLIGSLPKGKTFEVLEGGSGTNLEDNLKIEWPYTQIHTIELADKVPRKTTKIVFRIITAEKSAELDLVANSTSFRLSSEAQAAFRKASQQ